MIPPIPAARLISRSVTDKYIFSSGSIRTAGFFYFPVIFFEKSGQIKSE